MAGGSLAQFGIVDPTTSNATALAQYYTSHAIPQRFNPGIIVASIAVAILGAYSTLLLLGRRTSNKGVRNIFLLVLAATTMSFVGIWGMHFIGMHMVLAPQPGISWYISFNPGFTVFSLVVPAMALVLAFVFVDQAVDFSLWRIITSGMLTGGIVALMHYSASFESNFKVIYSPAQTVVSIILACVGASVALSMFFRYQAHWENSWWKRLICALILATAVSGMHYMGVWGTSYQVRPDQVDAADSLTGGRRRNVIVVLIIGIMCGLNIVISTFLAVTDVLVNRETRRKARKIVIASATFDRSGRMLVRADGSMPMVVIETKLRQAEVLEALDRRSATFQWLYVVSWDWLMVVPFLSDIAKRLFQNDAAAQRQKQAAEAKPLRRGVSFDGLPSRQPTSSTLSPADDKKQALVDFKDRVIFAAHELSKELGIPMGQVGVLYDHVLPTGTKRAAQMAAAKVEANKSLPGFKRADKRKGRREDAEEHAERRGTDDEESQFEGRPDSIFARGEEEDEGVTIFLVRELPNNAASATGVGASGPLPFVSGGGAGAEGAAATGTHDTMVDTADKYQSRGYRMTETRFLAAVLADRHGVRKHEMEGLLESLRVYARRGIRPVVQAGGVYAGLFGVRPSTSRQGGLDVLVYSFARHQLPSYRLPEISCLTPSMRAFLRLLDQLPLNEAMKACERDSIRSAERKKQLVARRHAELEEAAAAAAADRNRISDGEREETDLELMEELGLLESMIRFQTALYVSLDALYNSVRFYPNLARTARITAEVLEVPSSLDDSTAPAELILVQAVLPEERDREYPVTPTFSASSANVEPLSPTSHSPYLRRNADGAAQQQDYTTDHVGAGMVLPTNEANAASPFVFTPYTLFVKAQMMLLRGRQAEDFEHEVLIEMKRRFAPSMDGTGNDENEQVLGYEEGKMDRDDSEKSFGLEQTGAFGNGGGGGVGGEERRLEPSRSRKWFSSPWRGLDRGDRRRKSDAGAVSMRRLSGASFKSNAGMNTATTDDEMARREASEMSQLGKEEASQDPDEIVAQQQHQRPAHTAAEKSPSKAIPGSPHGQSLDMASIVTDALTLVPPSTLANTSSLGVRRFTAMGGSPQQGVEGSPSTVLARGGSGRIPQSCFARAPEDDSQAREGNFAEEEDEGRAPVALTSRPMSRSLSVKRTGPSPRAPARKTSRTSSQSQDFAGNQSPSWSFANLPNLPGPSGSAGGSTVGGRPSLPSLAHRPVTADPDSRLARTQVGARPSTAGAVPISPLSSTMEVASVSGGSSAASQRGQASNASQRGGSTARANQQVVKRNPASVRARLHSDDWYSRQLMALERGPLGHQLLGVLPSEY